MSSKSRVGTLDEAGGSYQFFFVWIQSLVFDTPMFKIFGSYLDFEGAKNIHVLQVLTWGFRGHWRFLIWGLASGDLVFEKPMFQILALYLDFDGAKNIHVVQVLHWGFDGHWRS